MNRRYKVVDVFSDRPLAGNPVAVVLDAAGLEDATMQRIAAWTNLSETTFVLPPTVPGADYRLRIFTPASELPFAGHPTLGSAHAALASGTAMARAGRLVQQCMAGLVNLTVDQAPVTGAASRLTLQLPAAKLRTLTTDEAAELQAALGTPFDVAAAPAAVDVGPVWLVARYATAQQVLALKPDLARMATLERRAKVTGVTVFGPHPAGSASAIEVRSFAPSCGVPEDPVCGSGNGSVAVFQRARGLLPAGDTAYVATQGGCVGRDGQVAVHLNAEGAVWLGGACVTTVEGVLSLGDG